MEREREGRDMLTTADSKGRKICNFSLHIEFVKEYYNLQGKNLYSLIMIKMEFEDNSISDVFTVSTKNLEKINWLEFDSRCWFNEDCSYSKIQRYLANDVRSKVNRAPKKKAYQLNGLGTFMIEGTAVFSIGEEVIEPSANKTYCMGIEVQKMQQRLKIDKKISEGKAVAGMFDLISLSPNPGRIMLTQKLVYLMRQAYIDAGVTPNICVYIFGKTGTHKTTYSSLLVQMYNCSRGIISPPRLDASIPATVKILTDTCDDVVVLDDLYPADSKKVRKQQEETFLEITRYIADGTMPARMRGKELNRKKPKCGVVFTGEYVIGSGSDAARILPVEMQQPDGEKMKYFQDNPLIVPTFYYFYLRWFIDNYKEIVKLIKEWLIEYRKTNFGIHARLQDTHFYLNTAYVLLLQYCCDRDFLSKNNAIQLHKAFCDLLMMLVERQNIKVQHKTVVEKQKENYFHRIQELYKNGYLTIAEEAKSFNEKEYDGVIHRNCIYLRGEKIEKYFPETSISDIADSLISQGVLETGKRNRTKQISALKGMRFYAIPRTYFQ